ncbi:MAG: K+/H+ antiporter subunit F [Bradymonadaceae bacterium]|nr:K+/H+ antiporter subunit F [Lujinxingiaceae bacterium]
MLKIALLIAFGLLSMALLMNLYRLLKGPSTLDRIVALDTMYINSIGVIILLGIYLRSDLFFEAALLIAMMGFVGTVALSKFLLRGNVIE